MDADIVVVGSLNHDLTVVTPHHPRPGETVLGTRHYSDNGGKGANQAVAAARLGGDVALIGRVGDDIHGRTLIAALAEEGVLVEGIGIDEDAPTGLAVITVDAEAENTIVVSPGANSRLGQQHIEARHESIASARVLLTQLEVPVDVVAAAVLLAEGLVCLNPAPAAHLPPSILSRVDVLVPNRSELAALVGVSEPVTPHQVAEAAARLDTDASVVVTLGADGALLIADGITTHVPAPEVDAVDPTGAGDAFCGALAEALSRDLGLGAAVERAVAAGALATTAPGAQGAMPSAHQLERLLNN
ncbi:MAG TPA: ribokinase [Acidimicrobiia bacterium]